MTEVHMIDDDVEIFELLKEYFEDTPYNLTHSELPGDGISYIKNNAVDLVILDLMLPGMDGFDVCKKLRLINPVLPIVMLTAKKDDINKIVGLEIGADDYLSKPFNPMELLARIKAVLRRSERLNYVPEKNKRMLNSPKWELIMDIDAHRILLKDKIIDFTSTEYELLKCLMENAGIVQSRDSLMNKVKGIEFEAFDRSIDVFISKIRQKLGDNKGEMIRTVRGTGYIFSEL